MSAPDRPKPVRVTLDLAPADYEGLNRWAAAATLALPGAPRITLASALRAMIRVVTGDEAPTCAARVLAELRAERS